MAAHCEVCGKQRRVANNVSHSNIKTKSIQRPNLRHVHARLENGAHRRIRACTRCIRSGLVAKA
jgi:large subunit ribosomal protein L28